MHEIERQRLVAQVDGISQAYKSNGRIRPVPRLDHGSHSQLLLLVLLPELRAGQVRLTDNENTHAAPEGVVDVVSDRLAEHAPRFGTRQRVFTNDDVSHPLSSCRPGQSPKLTLKGLPYVVDRTQGTGRRALDDRRSEYRLFSPVCRLHRAISKQHHLFANDDRQDRHIARQPKHLRLVPKDSQVYPFEVVVASVE